MFPVPEKEDTYVDIPKVKNQQYRKLLMTEYRIIRKLQDKELSTNNCCKFMAIFIVFPGFCLKQLQQLFSDNS
ncbi:type III toxin-antitoxin system ToxN/AbiQ family toxin [uncultured Acetatifactor sp.]|uniref:type III toxin-antitoxin system ToxN/AbiQ family toxin n=1 Tax=uncultured Acetatifactor sp. TaxID=1671927 RepID=UPI0034DDC769